MKNLLKKAVGKTLAIVKGPKSFHLKVRGLDPAKRSQVVFAGPGNRISSEELTQRLNELMNEH